jgi:hypothetical protein
LGSQTTPSSYCHSPLQHQKGNKGGVKKSFLQEML